MRQKRKSVKLWIVLALVVSLAAVQVMQVMAEDGVEVTDTSDSPIIVNDFAELGAALDQVEEGGTIGLNSVINIDFNIGQMGIAGGKHIYLTRVNADAGFEIAQSGNLTLCNMTIDGNQIASTRPMFQVSGTLVLNDVTVKNCNGSGMGGAIYVGANGSIITDSVTFDGNHADQGSHIYSEGTSNLSNTTLINGTAGKDGGAVKVGTRGTLLLSGCKLYGNSAGTYGGAVSNSGNVTMGVGVIFGNTAPAGSDIANDRNHQNYQMPSLTDLESQYAEMGITPTEWVFDCAEVSPEISAIFDTSNENSLIKLIYEDHRPGNDDGNEDGGDTGDQGGNDTGDQGGENTGDQGDNTGNQGGNETGDDTGNQGNTGADGDTGNQGDTGTGDNAGNGDSTDTNNENKSDSGSNTNPAVTNNEDNSRTTSTTDNHEDRSTTTTTNNYYAYNTPAETVFPSGKTEQAKQGGPGTAAGTAEEKSSGTAETEKESALAEESGDADSRQNVQMPDNISLNLSNVNIVYHMTDGRSNIEISNEKEEIEAVAMSAEPAETDVALVDTAVANVSSSPNWFEVVKMILLVAIFLVVVPKPHLKGRTKEQE